MENDFYETDAAAKLADAYAKNKQQPPFNPVAIIMVVILLYSL